LSIEINNESTIPVDEAAILRLAAFALDTMHVHADAELAIVLVDEGAMEQLHVQWMDEPGPTDVLSFPMDELRPGTEEQDETAGHSTLDELLLLTTHGVLHLLGFDHAEPDEEKEMFGIQRDILIGFTMQERQRH
jgi:probable rRNA maturation factor